MTTTDQLTATLDKLEAALTPWLCQSLAKGLRVFDVVKGSPITDADWANTVRPFAIFIPTDEKLPLSCGEIAEYVNKATGLSLKSGHVSAFVDGFDGHGIHKAVLLDPNVTREEAEGFHDRGAQLRKLYQEKRFPSTTG